MKNIFRLLRLLLLFATVSAYGQSATSFDSTALMKHISRPLYALDYPESWSVDTSKLLGVDLFLRTPQFDSTDNFSENLNVFIQKLKGQNYTLSQMGSESERQIKNLVTDVEILESRLYDEPQPYYALKYKGRQGKFLLITEQRYFLRNEVGFAFTMTTQDGKEAIYREAYDLIFNSIKLL